MTVVIGLGTRLDVRLENGVLCNGQQPGSAENSFFDYSKFVAMKSLSGWDHHLISLTTPTIIRQHLNKASVVTQNLISMGFD